MFPFWEKVVAPVLERSHARTIVEIGALRGENTELMLERLGPDVELHVIDPLPEFDPAAHEARFGGQYIFHRDLSLNVLPELPVMDAAIIDGDHNWFTVINECRQLHQVARAAGAPLPVMIFHDVDWPYGRRDLYYEPSQIPEEYRQPYDRKGIRRGRTELAPGGGMNKQLANALTEGGPRNGVMTAVDDFIEEYDRPLRLVMLPLYFGLAIVVEEDVLAARPELAELLDWLESAAGARELIELGEEIRTDEATWNQLVFTHHTSQLDGMTSRYLGLLKEAVLGELDRDNELRLAYLEESVRVGRVADPEILRDPLRGWQPGVRRLEAAVHSGSHADDTVAPVWFPPTSMGRHRLDHLERCLDVLREAGTPGDFVDVGVGRGGSGIFLRGYLEAHRISEPTVWMVDRFASQPAVTDDAGRLTGWSRGFPERGVDLDLARDLMDRHCLLDDRVNFLQGDPAVTLPSAPVDEIALLRIGAAAVDDVGAVLEAAYGALVPGGFVVIEDVGTDGAVDEFRSRHGITEPLERIDDLGVVWRRGATEPRVERPAPVAEPAPHRPPLAPASVGDPVDLSVVVVFYNMKREAERTLHSLSRAYQLDCDDLTFEVIVIDNGSSPEERLDAAWVESFGPEFRLVDMGPDAPPSPTPALNRGMAESRGDHIGFMIDGAHVVTPGVYHNVMTAQEAYGRSVVATQQFYVGPGQQSEMMAEGYGTDVEDRLFESIEWPAAGYRLFDIGSFIGDRDWFDGIPESNCLFVPRPTLARVGGFDDTFDEPSGGFTNLDLFERVAADPGVELVTMLGEGSFHQVHEGTTTNQPSPDERFARISQYVSKYQDLRGKPYKGPRKPIRYVGTLQGGAKRTKGRRRTAAAFIAAGRAGSVGEPTSPIPMPADTRDEFTEAYWSTLKWQKVSWLGTELAIPAGDLFAYQELLARVRPDHVIDVFSGDGARAYYLATICELLGHGQVVTVDHRQRERPTHDRLTQVVGPLTEDETVDQVRAIVAPGESALVVLGSRGRPPRLMREFDAYHGFVSVGSYVVLEMTAVNGHPFWPEYGPGPAEAVVRITNEHRNFIVDHEVEIHGLTFNPGGYLKRAR